MGQMMSFGAVPESANRTPSAPTSDELLTTGIKTAKKYNRSPFAKMRKFESRQRKRKVLDRRRDQVNDLLRAVSAQDANAPEIIPVASAEQEGRRRRLKDELLAERPQSKLSRQKQKRLDRYIEKKMRREETLALIKKLERQKIDTTLFQSSKRLGQVTETKRNVFRRALNERDAGINVEEANTILLTRRDSTAVVEDDTLPQTTQQPPAASSNGAETFGGGLKRPLRLSEDGTPIIKKRKRLVAPAVQPHNPVEEEGEEDPNWEGFSEDEDIIEPLAELEPHSGVMSEDGDTSLSSSSLLSQSDSDQSEDDSEDDNDANISRSSAFKAWAENQRNEAVGFTPSANEILPQPEIEYVPQPIEEDPLPPELQPTDVKRKPHAVVVDRSEVIQSARLALPILGEEQKIMEAIFSQDVVIISGATGSGKTTQVPQFLFENGFGSPDGPTPGMIGITQPRRVAALSMADRVGRELGSQKDRVAHQIRFDSTTKPTTAIKFMTDGILLREMASDFALQKYSVIIIDEAHERSVNTDILVSYVSRAVRVRRSLSEEKPKSYYPLKFLIMSATLQLADFNRVFDTPPVLLNVEGRQYPVQQHWSRATPQNWLEHIFKKVRRGHRKLPPGGMLVFLTGQNEIWALARRLRFARASTQRHQIEHGKTWVDPKDMPLEAEDLEAALDADRNTYAMGEVDVAEDWSDMDASASEDEDFDIAEESPDGSNRIPAATPRVHVLPLYSQLPPNQQLKVFEPPPDGSRLIVLSTNVAETSLTIPGIRYVFDCGRAKERQWDDSGVQTYETVWISKASADQRAGRAGRTGPGHCYRLYSSAMYEGFGDFPRPEIFRCPLEGVVLQLKALGVSRINQFPFPSIPCATFLRAAENVLYYLGALKGASSEDKRITPLGRELLSYPLNPRFAQMLRLGVVYGCVEPVIALVSALDVPNMIIPLDQIELREPIWTEKDRDREIIEQLDANESVAMRRRKEYSWGDAHLSRFGHYVDILKLYTAVSDYSRCENEQVAETYCKVNFLREKAVQDSIKLREQLTAIVKHHHPLAIPSSSFVLKLPDQTPRLNERLKLIAAAGFIDQVAIRADLLPAETQDATARKSRRATRVRYKSLLASHPEPRERGAVMFRPQDYVFIHDSSRLTRFKAKEMPAFVVYRELIRSRIPALNMSNSKTHMQVMMPASAEMLAFLARDTPLLQIGKPVGKIKALKEKDGLERRKCNVELRLRAPHDDGPGWFLREQSVVQRRVQGQGWVVEKWRDSEIEKNKTKKETEGVEKAE